MISKISTFLNQKIGNKKTDKIIEQVVTSGGGILFFILIVRKLSSLEITEFQMIVGITLAAFFMLQACIYSALIGYMKNN